RILATEGQHNYHAAKKKAAERLGVSERLALPSNLEVKDALLSYQALYGGTDHRDTIGNLLRVAARVMQALQTLQPRLVGSVLVHRSFRRVAPAALDGKRVVDACGLWNRVVP
uniref:hypothetical protein n=1 Tax=Alloalcanivorax venustensis TaxID=172371 RepID=UPI0035170CB5